MSRCLINTIEKIHIKLNSLAIFIKKVKIKLIRK